MSDLSDRLRDKWDSITPRERRLVVILGIAVPTILVIWLGLKISDGLDGREKKVQRMRKALKTLQGLRMQGEVNKPTDDALSQMTATLVPLETYVANAADKVGIPKPKVTPHNGPPKDGFVSQAVEFDVRDVTLTQLKDLLEGLETGSKLVAVTSLKIDKRTRDEEKDKLDARLEVTTYARAAPAEGGSGSGGAGTGSAAKGKGG